MRSSLRAIPRATARAVRNPRISTSVRTRIAWAAQPSSTPNPPPAPDVEQHSKARPPPVHIATTKRLPEFNLAGKVILVSGAARGLGLVQAEAVLEAGARVYCLDITEEPSDLFWEIQRRAYDELGTRLEYKCIDVRNVDELNKTIEDIGTHEGRVDGLIAAAGINIDKDALEYSAEEIKYALTRHNPCALFYADKADTKKQYTGSKYYRSHDDSTGRCEADDQTWQRRQYCFDWQYERYNCKQGESLYFFIYVRANVDLYRALYAHPTMLLKPASFSLLVTSPPNGVFTEFV